MEAVIKVKPFLLSLNEINKEDVEIVGNKAAKLAEIIRQDFSVPNGFVITTHAYEDFLKLNDLDKEIKRRLQEIDVNDLNLIQSVAKSIKEVILSKSLSNELKELIEKQFNGLKGKTVAVRSSGTAEDLTNASFAGQYDSYLNIDTYKNVIKAIKKCYASLWTTRAIHYRLTNKIPLKKVMIAVIIQEMVPAHAGGVLFTKNPVSKDKSEIIVESTLGLGDSVVSGNINPDLFKIARAEISQSKSLKILSKEQSEKSHFSLKEEQVLKLARIGLKIENYFGAPQDIEWALDQRGNFQILQTRPITSIDKIAPMENVCYSRGYSDDYWNDNCTPLYFNLLGDQLTYVVNMELNSIMGYKRMDSKLLRLHKGHVYFNLDVLKRKVQYEIPPFLRNEDVMNYFPQGGGKYGKLTVKDLSFKLPKRIIAELRIKFHDPDGAINKTASKYEEWTQNKFIPYCQNFDSELDRLKNTENLGQLLGLAESIDDIMVNHFRLVRYGIPVHNIGVNLMLQYLLKRLLGKKNMVRLYPILISGLEHKLAETNEEIHYLASLVQDSQKIKRLILESPSKKLMSYISSETDPEIQVFYKEVEKFLENYGDRGFTREVFYPRWREAPEYVFDILKSLVKGKEQEFKRVKEKNRQHRENIVKFVEAKIRSQRFGFIKWKLVSKILELSRRYIVFREAQRFNLDRWITRNRNVYLKIGGILQDKGILKDKEDIFFLYKREIKNIVQAILNNETIKNYKPTIQKRITDFLKYEDTVPPKFIQGSYEFNDPESSKDKIFLYKGIPASQGIITGKARVIAKIEEITKVADGEILVVSRTDPGWTPVFSKIGGLITETGGILSHGAVVSREYGIPAVTNIPKACTLFETGSILTVNGFTGEVNVKK
ncbi:MAG: hypothetical protein GF383_12395 [Candidatus Lokiarchaeota archaeon]|nr:hypothetical protein [Candidatus Lokiarchaeota archaeon]MBD3341800.1 hypothetical protein [Candidatus Lokiarchaeota archaeon]